MIPRFLNILSAVALIWGTTISAMQTVSQAFLTGGGVTVLNKLPSAGQELHAAADVLPVIIARADSGIQLITGMLLIVLGGFLHALARMQNGERPVHITVKPAKKRQMWFWVDMRI